MKRRPRIKRPVSAISVRHIHRSATPLRRRRATYRAVICALGLAGGEAGGAELIELGQLGTGGFRIDGLAELDSIGYSVSSAGDVNGDGLDDVILGAPYIGTGGPYGTSGTAYVVFGKADNADVDLPGIGERGFLITGIGDGDDFGFSVAGAGDVNGDGLDDLVIGAPLADPAGESFVVFGKADGADVDLADLGTAQDPTGFRIVGIDAGDEAGHSVAGAGDVNGDGLADVIIGAPGAEPGGNARAGESYVVFGKDDNTQVDLADLGSETGLGGFKINGIDPFDEAGASVSGVSDFNGDGLDDVIIGVAGASNSAGENYIVFGKTENTTVGLINLGTSGFRIDGTVAGDRAGASVSGAGDVNGDGLDDALIGAPGTGYAGATYVLLGRPGNGNVDLTNLGAGGFRINGLAPARIGASVSSVGDVNGDGLDDLILGAPFADPGGREEAGESIVVFGKADALDIDLANLGSGGFRIAGKDVQDRSGGSVAGGGDLNGDGLSDLVIGAPGAEFGGQPFAGEGYIVFAPLPTPRPLFFTDRNDFLDATQATVASAPYVFADRPPEPYLSGNIAFSTPGSPRLVFGQWPADFPDDNDFELAISDFEDLDIALAEGFAYAMGIDFDDATGGSTPSTFTVTVFASDSEIASFQFNTQALPDQNYIGLWAAVPFNRLEIREASTANENEFFGTVSTGQSPLPTRLFRDRFSGNP